MSDPITIGTATAAPGQLSYGRWEAFDHPTGATEFLPVILAQGRRPGPCLWLTAGIHGPEHSGPVVLYQLLNQELVDQLRGTVVAIPALSPAGLQTKAYVPYHVDVNPNRLWPHVKPAGDPDPEKHPPYSIEQAFQRLFDEIAASADYLIDYHNAWIGSLSFAFRDRVLYRADQDEEANRSRAEALSARLDEMLAAYGHSIITEFTTDRYVKEKLHRSTSGAALLVANIPAITVELGAGLMPDLRISSAAAAGTRNVMRWAGMLAGEMEAIEEIPVVEPGFRVRRTTGLRAPMTGIVLHEVDAGQLIRAGDRLARMVDAWGRERDRIYAEHDGLVLGRAHGIYFYEGDTILHLAIRDDAPLVGPYPADFFTRPGESQTGDWPAGSGAIT